MNSDEQFSHLVGGTHPRPTKFKSRATFKPSLSKEKFITIAQKYKTLIDGKYLSALDGLRDEDQMYSEYGVSVNDMFDHWFYYRDH